MTTCPTCTVPFEPRDADHTYCSPGCRPEVQAELDALAAAQAAPVTARPADTPSFPPRSGPKRRPRSERFAALNAFVDMGMADLTGAETKVWLALFRDVRREGTARTAQAYIARRAGLSVRAVKLALRSLTARGMVRVVYRGRLNAGVSIYTVRPVGAHGEA